MTIKISCKFSQYPHLVCDDSGQFWILPHKSGKKNLPLRKIKKVIHAKKPHINYKNHRISLTTLRERAEEVSESFEVKEKNLPF